MAGYTPDEKLRLQQLRALRRRWLKDQELSPREPVLPPQKLGPVDRFWKRFLQPGSFWRLQTFKLYRAGVYTVGWLLIPAWIVDYYTKYHIMKRPYGIVAMKHRIYPGDKILETGEIIPPFKEEPTGHH
ncbi:NADH dehydrogenase [ubiquinone] 1 beta subcomplex subunit 6 isoform X1 [Chrysemys picta bellii]|uniref:NADH dehydrogenase [ubiquinone] 1 beta subcomplex subunit 6 n=1 Tax=Chrysemys picta bellii TaxID=8478 RepID=A0A8C3H9C2_CHRPI|nr:NADH dehydrogenase [ubiquinone] 1 beta subcomplex subunit 6 isoform X1 [Chrysemys picta bellii]